MRGCVEFWDEFCDKDGIACWCLGGTVCSPMAFGLRRRSECFVVSDPTTGLLRFADVRFTDAHGRRDDVVGPVDLLFLGYSEASLPSLPAFAAVAPADHPINGLFAGTFSLGRKVGKPSKLRGRESAEPRVFSFPLYARLAPVID